MDRPRAKTDRRQRADHLACRQPYGGYAILAACIVWACVTAPAAGAERPNIVYILADDLGVGDVSCYQFSHQIETVHLDALAREGARFSDAHSGSAVCTPTRYGILTGRYSWRTRLKSGVTWGTSPCLIESGRMTVASFLKGHGYRTACVGKWHLGLDWSTKTPGDRLSDDWETEMAKIDFAQPIQRGPLQCGFDYFFGIPASLDMPPYVYIENDRVVSAPTDSQAAQHQKRMMRAGPAAPGFTDTDVLPELTRRAVSWLEQQNGQTPFFLYLPLTAPHTPVAPAKTYQGRSQAGTYGDFVLQCDDVVGTVVDTLKRLAIFDQTLLIFTSDNGCAPAGFPLAEEVEYRHTPSGPFKGRKSHIYEGGHRVPMIAHWPGHIPAGHIVPETVCHQDLLATCADILQVKLADHVAEDSVSFGPFLHPHKPASPGTRPVVHQSANGMLAIRRGPWKLICGTGHGGFQEIKEPVCPADPQLYRLDHDPGEAHEVSGANPALVHELREELVRLIQAGRSTPGPAQTNDGPSSWPQLAGLMPDTEHLSTIVNFATDRLIAWCIVPFDARRRGPRERAEMVRRLGMRRVAYDWRDEHVPQFEDEILQYQQHGIEFFAFWSWHPQMEPLVRKYGIRPQIWESNPSPAAESQSERVAATARQLLPLVEKARELNCPFGLYNHGGWGGEPANLVAVCEYLRRHHQADHVGIVYNFHHAHEHIDDFPQVLAQMLPYLICLNLNGMNPGAQPKILPIGQGQHERAMIKAVIDSGYSGPIGIIDHREEIDAEQSLRENLDGLKKIVPMGPLLDGPPS